MNWFSLVFTLVATSFAATCPSYTHKDDIAIGNPALYLPEGFAVYGMERKGTTPLLSITKMGLYKTALTSFNSVLVPGTEKHVPNSVDISEDGNWFVYASGGHVWLVPEAGGTPVQVDTLAATSIYRTPYFTGFLRKSPKGSEIWYLDGDRKIFARMVDLTGPKPVLGAVRSLLNLNSSTFYTQRDIQISVVGNHILCALFTMSNPYAHRTVHITIPDKGNGTASEKDIYAFNANPPLAPKEAGDIDPMYIYGCGHALSPDGSKAVSNSGSTGNECVPSKWTSPDTDHKGFMMTKFMESTEPPIDLANIILDSTYGRSINWIPSTWRKGNWNAYDFNNWAFANDERYVIGAQNGYLSEVHALWVVDWSHSIWYPITPLDTVHGSPTDPAVFIGKVGTVYSSSGTAGDYDPTLDPQNPLYKIIAPKTGKVLSVLKPCTLQIASVRKGSASIAFRRGRESIVLPEFNRSVDPTSKDSIIIFTPPQSILNQSGTTTILNGSGWVAYAQDYGNATFSAVSGAFSFYDPNPPSSILGDNGMSGSFGFFHTSVLKAGQLHLQLPKGDIQLRIYSTMGKMLWEQSISSTVPRQFRLSLALPDQSVIVKF